MTDSSMPDDPAVSGQEWRARRIERIKRWIEYIDSTPAAVWGPQQNCIIESQLDALRGADISVAQLQRVERARERRSTERDSEVDHRPEAHATVSRSPSDRWRWTSPRATPTVKMIGTPAVR